MVALLEALNHSRLQAAGSFPEAMKSIPIRSASGKIRDFSRELESSTRGSVITNYLLWLDSSRLTEGAVPAYFYQILIHAQATIIPSNLLSGSEAHKWDVASDIRTDRLGKRIKEKEKENWSLQSKRGKDMDALAKVIRTA